MATDLQAEIDRLSKANISLVQQNLRWASWCAELQETLRENNLLIPKPKEDSHA